MRSFYVPFIADPVRGRPRRSSGSSTSGAPTTTAVTEAYLEAHCNTLHLDPIRNRPCGDWQPLGPNLTGANFGQTRAR